LKNVEENVVDKFKTYSNEMKKFPSKITVLVSYNVRESV